jgi:hypothetical protein
MVRNASANITYTTIPPIHAMRVSRLTKVIAKVVLDMYSKDHANSVRGAPVMTIALIIVRTISTTAVRAYVPSAPPPIKTTVFHLSVQTMSFK